MNYLPSEYSSLFNGVTGIIKEMEFTIEKLKLLQQQAEEIYISEPEVFEETLEVGKLGS